jgi:hypothetical protein
MTGMGVNVSPWMLKGMYGYMRLKLMLLTNLLNVGVVVAVVVAAVVGVVVAVVVVVVVVAVDAGVVVVVIELDDNASILFVGVIVSMLQH